MNLIVYLNREWDDAWGGSLQLHSDPRSAGDQITTVTPLYNRAVIFETNEYSWHGFPPIALPAERSDLSRKSIALYFYTPDRPDEELAATHSTVYVDRPLPDRFRPGLTLSAADIEEIHVLLARRDGHIQRLYKEVISLTAQLEAARNASNHASWRKLAHRLARRLRLR